MKYFWNKQKANNEEVVSLEPVSEIPKGATYIGGLEHYDYEVTHLDKKTGEPTTTIIKQCFKVMKEYDGVRSFRRVSLGNPILETNVFEVQASLLLSYKIIYPQEATQ